MIMPSYIQIWLSIVQRRWQHRRCSLAPCHVTSNLDDLRGQAERFLTPYGNKTFRICIADRLYLTQRTGEHHSIIHAAQANKQLINLCWCMPKRPRRVKSYSKTWSFHQALSGQCCKLRLGSLFHRSSRSLKIITTFYCYLSLGHCHLL